MARDRPARAEDVHDAARRMPFVKVVEGKKGNLVYQVGGKSFVFFRTPRPDAFDPDTGERWDDVIVIWVPDEADKQALVQDRSTPYFTNSHFEGHPSVLVRGSRLHETTRSEIIELVEDAWLSRASARRAQNWLASHPAP
ncbi:hypothetical protein GCM10027053_17140 [Intrasporangium mesophilum]